MLLNALRMRLGALPRVISPICWCQAGRAASISSTASTSSSIYEHYGQFIRRQFSTSNTLLQKNKMKTHKGTAKRWSSLPSGQYKRGRPGKRHLNVSLSSERLNRLGHTGYATPAQKRVLKCLLPGQ